MNDELLRNLADMRSDGQCHAAADAPVGFNEGMALSRSPIVTVLPSDSPPVRYKGAIHVRIVREGA